VSAAKITRIKFLEELAEYADSQRQLIEAECTGFSTNAIEKQKRKLQGEAEFRFFFNTYFPHYSSKTESIFHQAVFDEIPALIDALKGIREAWAAPRGEAKSTLFALALVIWCTVTGRKKFIGILMDSMDQSEMMIEAVKVELESNPRLAMDYPEATGPGPRWRIGFLITKNGVAIKSGGMDKKLRGWRRGPHRPDLVLLDDIENDDNVRKPEQRDKLQKKINKAVLKLGPPDGSMDVIFYGTILMYDSVLARTMDSPTWHSRRFQAIVQWPDAMDMWETWEEVFINFGEEKADTFYNKNKKSMDKGGIVSWPGMRPLVMLMKIRAEDHDAFDTEYQNDPGNSDDAPFKDLTYWVQPCRDWIYYGCCDPSLGKHNKGRDPSAILVGGFDRNHGILDVVEANIKRRVPDKIISDIIQYQKDYSCLVWGFESTQFQEFVRTELVKRSAKALIPVPAVPVLPITDKALRIESLQPHVFNGLIRFHRNHQVLIRQLRFWPEADHDDGPDALEMLWKLALSGAGGVPRIKTSRRKSRAVLRGHH
jgi:predicted phage terminase large subunit-like protein